MVKWQTYLTIKSYDAYGNINTCAHKIISNPGESYEENVTEAFPHLYFTSPDSSVKQSFKQSSITFALMVGLE